MLHSNIIGKVLDLIQSWPRGNLDIVFFVYGLAFVVMGIAILLQPKKDTEFRLADILWFLAAFAITHGINEFLDMWAIIKGRNAALDIARWLALLISYLFLFEFGRRLLRLTSLKSFGLRKKFAQLLTGWLTLGIEIFILIFAFTHTDFWKIGSILARYLLGFPAGLLISVGLKFYYEDTREILGPIKAKKYFLWAGISFFAYGFLGGLVVPKAEFFPSNLLNTESFLSVVHMPVQVFRAGCALVSAAGVWGILRIFNWERTRKIQDALALRERVTEGIDEAILLVVRDYKIIWMNKKAKELYGDISGDWCYHATHSKDTPCQPPNDICPITEVLKTGTPQTHLHTHFDKEGKRKYIEVSAYPIRNEKNEITEFVHISRDVTEKLLIAEDLKKAYEELKRAQQELIQSEKLAALGRFSSGLAHEVKNPLAIILSGIEFLETKLQKSDSDIKNDIGKIKEAVFRADSIVRELLKFAKPSESKLEKINPNDLIGDTISLFEYKFSLVNIKIKLELSKEEVYIEVDRGQVQQVLFNILLNALDAMPKGGEIKIKTYKAAQPDLHRDKPTCAIEISDTGEGIPKGNLSKLFEPFFTTKRDKKGVGLGLSISKTIVNNNKGDLAIDSELGRGTNVKITFPLYPPCA